MKRRAKLALRPGLHLAGLVAGIAMAAAPARPVPLRASQQPAPGAPSRIVIRGDPALAGVGAALVEDHAVWKPMPGIGTLPAVGIDSLELWITSDLSTDLPEGVRHSESWVAGTADPTARRIALRSGPGLSGPGGLRTVLRHELAHLALGAVTGNNYPRWLTEGYAQYVSGEWGIDDAWHLQSVFLRRGAGTLEQIDVRFRRHSLEARMGYLLSYTAVHELASMGGEAGLTALFRRLREGEAFPEALRRTYGITEEAFEERWKRSLVDRYGWLYLLSRAGAFWLAVTGLVLFVAFRRARRDHERLERMRLDDVQTEGGGPAAGPPGWPEGSGPEEPDPRSAGRGGDLPSRESPRSD